MYVRPAAAVAGRSASVLPSRASTATTKAIQGYERVRLMEGPFEGGVPAGTGEGAAVQRHGGGGGSALGLVDTADTPPFVSAACREC
ncbi:hypothetical protein KCMC57_up02320 [Kitasatospora sp. CMC57]|uniref:Uncharacterized protein n=1 Tax=Kitasatospora sp. CMC57 TaxID=3231513 RepID=A0AB33JQW5_9ACTN